MRILCCQIGALSPLRADRLRYPTNFIPSNVRPGNLALSHPSSARTARSLSMEATHADPSTSAPQEASSSGARLFAQSLTSIKDGRGNDVPPGGSKADGCQTRGSGDGQRSKNRKERRQRAKEMMNDGAGDGSGSQGMDTTSGQEATVSAGSSRATFVSGSGGQQHSVFASTSDMWPAQLRTEQKSGTRPPARPMSSLPQRPSATLPSAPRGVSHPQRGGFGERGRGRGRGGFEGRGRGGFETRGQGESWGGGRGPHPQLGGGGGSHPQSSYFQTYQPPNSDPSLQAQQQQSGTHHHPRTSDFGRGQRRWERGGGRGGFGGGGAGGQGAKIFYRDRPTLKQLQKREEDEGWSSADETELAIRTAMKEVNLKREKAGTGSVVEGKKPEAEMTMGEKEKEIALSEQIGDFFGVHHLSPEAIAARKKRRDFVLALEKIINNRWKRTEGRYTVEAFGSTLVGLDSATSDLDLCIVDPDRPDGILSGSETGGREDGIELPTIYQIRVLAKELAKGNICKSIQPIPSANVPILKVESLDGIKADINVNEQLGHRNSRLLQAYCDMSPIVRPLCIFVKTWAKRRRINDPSGQKGPITLSSYTLILMVISYLQTIKALPNLQDLALIERSGVKRDVFWKNPPPAAANDFGNKRRRRHNVRQQQVPSDDEPVGCDTTFVTSLPEDLKGLEDVACVRWDLTLAQAAKGFFRHYGRDFDYEGEIVSIRNHGTMKRSTSFDPIQGSFLDSIEVDGKREEAGQLDENGEAARASERDGEGNTAEDKGVLVAQTLEPDSNDIQNARLYPVEGKASGRQTFEETFSQPTNWKHRLVCQDPFLLSRNTAKNVQDVVISIIQKEMNRAYECILAGADLDEIYKDVKTDEAYESLTKRVRHARSARDRAINLKVMEALKRKNEKKTSSMDDPGSGDGLAQASGMVAASESADPAGAIEGAVPVGELLDDVFGKDGIAKDEPRPAPVVDPSKIET